MADYSTELLKAWKNGICQHFTRRQWEVLGTDKYGWVLEPAVPKEVAAIAAAAPTAPVPTEKKTRKKRAK